MARSDARLARIETQLELLTKAIDKRNERDDKQDDETDNRLRAVENRQHWYSGVGSIAGLVLGALITYGFGKA